MMDMSIIGGAQPQSEVIAPELIERAVSDVGGERRSAKKTEQKEFTPDSVTPDVSRLRERIDDVQERKAQALKEKTEDELRQYYEQIAEAVSRKIEFASSSELNFTYNENLGRSLVQVVDAETKDVVMELPPERLIKIYEQLKGIEEQLFAQGKGGESGLLVRVDS